jgi:2-polyprenyl-6-methoxyphenol hydroxylase-like FAD-dependent oxidoreductase
MRAPRPLIVFGCGPIGLLAAIRGRQLGLDVEIHASERPPSHHAPRVECVPSQTIALLVEFGVHPRLLGVDRLFSERSMQWSGFAASTSPTPAVAHVERPALDIALLELALRAGANLHALGAGRLDEFRRRQKQGNCLLLDATGRSAITAARRIAPKRPIVARLFHLAMHPSLRSTGLMIAAGPDGYAYRLANAATLTIGIVGRNDFVRGDGDEIVARIADFAPWLVGGIAGDDLQPGASGPASAQFSLGDDATIAIGDAAFARDALASQGLAIGFSDALKAVAQPEQRYRHRIERQKAIAQHAARVAEQIESSAFRSSKPWIEYAQFLSEIARPATLSRFAPAQPASS